MPFGTKNTGATLVHKTKKHVKGFNHLERYIASYKNWNIRSQVLDEFLGCLRLTHLAIRPTKCLFDTNFVKFWVYLVGGSCITINQENFENICQAKRATTKKRGTIVLGTCKSL